MYEKCNYEDKQEGRHTANKINIARCTTFPSLCSLSKDNIRNFIIVNISCHVLQQYLNKCRASKNVHPVKIANLLAVFHLNKLVFSSLKFDYQCVPATLSLCISLKLD